MSLPDPATAGPRPDLDFLRHRGRPPVAATSTAPNSIAVASTAPNPIAATRTAPNPIAVAAAVPASSGLDLSSLELSGQAVSRQDLSGLDLSGLDLSAPNPSTPAVAARAAPTRTAALPPLPRLAPTGHLLFTPKAPVLALTRLQSGIGTLTFECLSSAAVGDLRLGCAYQLRSGESSTVQQTGGHSTAPRNSRSPIFASRREQFERLTVDLRYTRGIARFIVLGFSDSDQSLSWGGTLVVSTFGGARAELPLDRPASTGVMVFMSVYVVAGELVIRAEMEILPGSVRDACKSYGFDRITWIDARTPLD